MKNLCTSLKRRWKLYLDRLAEANRRQYGTTRLDCCNLDRGQSEPPRHNKR